MVAQDTEGSESKIAICRLQRKDKGGHSLEISGPKLGGWKLNLRMAVYVTLTSISQRRPFSVFFSHLLPRLDVASSVSTFKLGCPLIQSSKQSNGRKLARSALISYDAPPILLERITWKRNPFCFQKNSNFQTFSTPPILATESERNGTTTASSGLVHDACDFISIVSDRKSTLYSSFASVQ